MLLEISKNFFLQKLKTYFSNLFQVFTERFFKCQIDPFSCFLTKTIEISKCLSFCITNILLKNSKVFLSL